MRGELYGFFMAGIRFLKSGSSEDTAKIMSQSTAVGGMGRFAYAVIPDGWIDQNAVRGCEFFYEHCIKPLKDRDLSGFQKEAFIEEFGSMTPYNFLCRLVIPSVSKVIEDTGKTQVVCGFVRVASALEWYRQDNGKIPESLSELVPDYLDAVPTDPVSQGEIGFQKEGTSYRLTAVGMDGVVGGAESDDWVWRLSEDR